MEFVQNVTTAARTIRAENMIVDKSLPTGGRLYCREQVPLELIQLIERLVKVELTVVTGPAPKLEGAFRSGPDFDLWLDIPLAEVDPDRLRKENEQLQKVVANSQRQLANKSFVAKAPAHMIDGMRATLAW